MSQSKIKFIGEGMKWFDKVNGNTYHSVRITRIDTGEQIACEFQYGYGDQYRHTALVAMNKAGWIPGEEKDVFLYERENDYPIHWTCSDGLKREVVANGVVS